MLSRDIPALFVTLLVLVHSAVAFPSYASLAGLSKRQLADILPGLIAEVPGPLPSPPKFNGTKLVNDAEHPWMPLRAGDIRGPCPGVNTLASHGYLPRDGVATPAQILAAVQEGFNMEYKTAMLVTYAAMLVDGNIVTDLLSIGSKTAKTGPDTGAPAIIGGLNTHSVFEGDASLIRADDFFGDNHSFNQTLFDQFVDFSRRYGKGFYTYDVAAELRYQRIRESIATNPTFSFVSPRYFTAYAESTFPVNFFVDGRSKEKKLGMDAALSFFRDSKFPDDFYRPAVPTGADGITLVILRHPVAPGANVGGVNNYIEDPTSANFATPCKLYYDFVNKTVCSLYPDPTGVLRRNLIINLRYLYVAFEGTPCAETFPYGRL